MFFYGHRHKGCTFLHCFYVCILTNRKKCLRSAFNLQAPRFCSRKSTNKFLAEIITEPNVKDYIKCLVSKYQNRGLNSANVVQNTEFKSLSAIIDKRIKIMDDIKALSELVQMDAKMKPLATEEELLYEENLKEIDIELLSIILNNYSVPNYNSIIVEIQAGVGGDEATLFVLDLYNMYIGHIKYLGFSIETILDDDVGQSGYRHVAISVSGNQAFEKLRFEGGVHRVQRIPYTEKLGRVHTSTASVAILPILTNAEVELHPRDLKIETKKSSGPGGQHVNCTDSAVRITHIPTGIISVCQMGRSQHKNKEIALQKLRNMLYEQILQRQTTFRSNMRKQQLGLRMRNEKIRTYNFQQDRVTDHRLDDGTVHNIKNFMKGGKALEEIENKLIAHMQKELIMDIIKQTNYFKT